ncbi:MAG: hypothetical protein EBT78_01900 [Betaproteobacteria bacterium]|nr:hypothetical protein [Betaproteobacteria bacterium]NBT66500.1 hypothetical protein [Betaproteobacteria bacterium]NBY08072.1 hypothetical protein [Betaproteobacteria bacterium]
MNAQNTLAHPLIKLVDNNQIFYWIAKSGQIYLIKGDNLKIKPQVIREVRVCKDLILELEERTQIFV